MGLRAALADFPLETIVQLLAATAKTGRVEVRGDDGAGWLGLAGGRLVAAEFEDATGPLALGALFALRSGDLEFAAGEAPDREDLSGGIDDLLDQAIVERDRIARIREVIPSDRVRFRLSERAAERAQITLSPDQWRTLLAVDGERDVAAIAERLGMTRHAAHDVLADLVRSGMVDTAEPPADASERPGYRRLEAMAPLPSTSAGESVVLRGSVAEFPLETVVQLLAGTAKTGRLEIQGDDGLAILGFGDGRLSSATAGEEDGDVALGLTFTLGSGSFDFVPMSEQPGADLTGDLDELLDRAAELRDRIAAVRALIPSDRSRVQLSDRAARNVEISLTSEQWRALLAVGPQRDVAMVAEALHMRRLPAMMLLADLARGGFVDIIPVDAEIGWPYIERRPAPWQPAPVAPPAPVEEPETPVAEAPPAQTPLAEETAPEETAEPDIRLSWVPTPVAEPEPAPAAEAEPASAERAWPEATRTRPEPVAGQPLPQLGPLEEAPPLAAELVAKWGSLFGGLFGGKAAAPSITPPATPPARTPAGQLALFANELIAAYNGGQYGPGRVEDRMIGLLMRVDEQADPIDRPIPVTNERLDVGQIDADIVAQEQAVPYLAILVRQVHDDAARVLGKDRARRGFRDVRDRVFGKDQTLLQSPEVAGHMPKA